MAKFIKINNNLSINIDSIYSIAYETTDDIENKEEIEDFEIKLNNYCSELPYLEVEPGVMWRPDSEEYKKYKYKEDYDERYCELLTPLIIENVGEIPEKIYHKNYYLILTNGTKVNIDKVIYDKIMENVEI